MKPVLILWVVILLLKLALAVVLPLYPDEAYYWVWSHHLQLSYYDHPGFIAWLISLGHFLEPMGNAVRWPAVILGHCSILFWLALLKPNFSSKQLIVFLILMTIAPLMGFGSILLTPDLPLLFFWSASIYMTIQALESSKMIWYLALGTTLGLGFCSKYHIVIYVPWALLWLSLERKWQQVSIKGITLTIISGLIFSLPVLFWNFQNDFISFLFQFQHGLVREKFEIKWPIEYIVQQLILFLPPLLIIVARTKLPERLKFLHSVLWVPLGFFLLTSFKGPVEANWPSLAHPGFLAIASYSDRKFWRRFFVTIWATAALLLLSEIYYPWMHVANISQFSQLPRKYSALADKTKKFAPLWTDTYQSAALLSYYGNKFVYKLHGLNRFDQYDLFPESKPQVSSFYILITRPDYESTIQKMDSYKIEERTELGDGYTILKVHNK